MSVLPQELMRKISAESRESSEHLSSSRKSHHRFRELMKVNPADEKTKRKSFFSLVEEEEEEESVEPSSTAFNTELPILAKLNTELDSEKSAALAAACATAAATLALATANATPAPSGQICLAAEIEALFEKMASGMIMMSSSGETETTLYFDNPHFASSVLFGAQITIREFSTAPKAFNIEIISAPNAIALLDAGKQGLLSAFQTGNFNFSVHRIDTHVQSEDRPVLHRKDSQDRDQQEQKGGRER